MAGRVAGAERRLPAGRSRAASPRLSFALLLFFALPLSAADLQVSPTRVRLDENVRITLTLEGDAARIDDVALPVTNLQIDSGPSVSSQFSWTNGVTSRRKSFTWFAHPEKTGTASAGPLVVTSGKGREVVPAVTIEVLEETVPGVGGGPDAILDRYATERREEVTLIAEISNPAPYVGQQTIVTWYVYARDAVRDFRVAGNPQLTNFWSEEIPIRRSEGIDLDTPNGIVRKLPVRSVALYPLASGTATIPPIDVEVEVLRPLDLVGGIFGRFEARLVDVRRKSPPLTVQVRPIPEGAEPTGTFRLDCGKVNVPARGAVTVEATVSGDGNLRSANAPKFAGAVDAEVEVQPGTVKVDRAGGTVRMTRTWRFLLYPSKSGELTVPPLTFSFFDPQQGSVRTLSCGGTTVPVQRVESEEHDSPNRPSRVPGANRWMLASVLALLAVATLALLMARAAVASRRRKREAAALVGETAADTQHRLESYLAERGTSLDALRRAAKSTDETRDVDVLLELHRRDRQLEEDVRRELAARIERLLRQLR